MNPPQAADPPSVQLHPEGIGRSATTAAVGYIPEIDGLRAFAVLSVMLYHLNRHLLPGGFVGVDTFFVISGYVVTSSLWRDVGRPFGGMIVQFYARRVLRIVPALAVCLLVTAIPTVLFIPDAWMNQTIRDTGIWAFFGASNIALFNAETYFSPAVELNPFAQTWTLGVEEQFYVLLPGIIYLFVRSRFWPALPRALCRNLLPALCVLSFLILVWNSDGDQKNSFYLLPARFWELGLGALLFQVRVRAKFSPLSPASRHGLLAVGALIGVAAGIFADFHAFPFPWAIPAALGALAIVAAVTESREVASPLANLLRHPVFSGIGKISYSLYLWHWPVFVLFCWTVGLAGVVMPVVALALTFLLSTLSYVVVEEPIRHGRRVLALPKPAIVGAGLAVVLIGAVGLDHLIRASDSLSLSIVMRARADWYPDTWPAPLTPNGCAVKQTITELSDGTLIETLQRPCVSGMVRRLIVVGDSHAWSLRPIFFRLANDEDIRVVRYDHTSCSFLRLIDVQPQCEAFTRLTVADIAKTAAPGDVVFMPSLRMNRLVDERGPLDDERVDRSERSSETVDRRRVAYRQAVNALGALEGHGLRLVLLAPEPLFRASAFRCSDWFDAANPVCRRGLTIARADLERYRQPVMDSIAELVRTYPDLVVWDMLDILCPDGICRAVTESGHPLFFDDNHLSGYANRILYQPFTAMLHHVLQGPAREAPGAPRAVN